MWTAAWATSGTSGTGSRCPIGETTTPSPSLFFLWSAIALLAGLALAALALYLFGPRLGELHPLIPRVLWPALAIAAGVLWLWWAVLLRLLCHEAETPS